MFFIIFFFFFTDTATTEIYTLSLHDALPIFLAAAEIDRAHDVGASVQLHFLADGGKDRKSTRLHSSHPSISYAVFCLKKQKRHLFSFSFKYINVPKCLDTDSLSCR